MLRGSKFFILFLFLHFVFCCNCSSNTEQKYEKVQTECLRCILKFTNNTEGLKCFLRYEKGHDAVAQCIDYKKEAVTIQPLLVSFILIKKKKILIVCALNNFIDVCRYYQLFVFWKIGRKNYGGPIKFFMLCLELLSRKNVRGSCL